MQNKPQIILVRPQLPENIGMVARAMDNCGLDKLILVSPRKKWPNLISIKSAANSKEIVENAKVFHSLEQALSNFNLVIATSSRKRFLKKPSIENFNDLFYNIPKKKEDCFCIWTREFWFI